MPIIVVCGHCQASFGAKRADAGKRGKCPKCRGEIVVPLPAAPPRLTTRLAPANTGKFTPTAAASRTAPVNGADRSGAPRPIARPALALAPPAIRAPRVHPAQAVLDAFQGSTALAEEVEALLGLPRMSDPPPNDFVVFQTKTH